MRDQEHYNKWLRERRRWRRQHDPAFLTKRRESNKRWRHRHPEVNKAGEHRRHLRRRFRISPHNYLELLKRQNGRCAICLDLPNSIRLAVDHNHATSEIRGLLCGRCNRAISIWRENPAMFERASIYLYDKKPVLS